ncbi:MAG: alpha/beta fold hydrolase [Bacteroidales bacterium]
MKVEQFIAVSDSIRLWTRTFGQEEHEACLLMNGAGANSSFWSERLCSGLSQKGLFVITYDHRDFGYSDKVDFETHPFDVMDLANDAVTILDSLEITHAHIVGHSMGGFIAQLLAIHHPERVRTFTSVSSSTNSPLIPPPPARTWKIFMDNHPAGHFEKDLKGFLPVWEYLNGTASFDKELAVDYTRKLYERQEIRGALGESHVKAQASLTDRTELLQGVKVPALIIHGEEDYLVDVYGGIQTASSLLNSRLVVVPEMGHMLFNQEIKNNVEDHIIEFIMSQK